MICVKRQLNLVLCHLMGSEMSNHPEVFTDSFRKNEAHS